VFESLDYIYMPSRDVAADAHHLSTVLGAEVLFAIDAMGTRVAMLKLSDSPPRVLLADHVGGEVPILVYRVASLDAATSDLEQRGWQARGRIELPVGPACSFTTPGGQRIAIYESTRPSVVEGFAGRRDFDV
jgi:hypothetical protein